MVGINPARGANLGDFIVPHLVAGVEDRWCDRMRVGEGNEDIWWELIRMGRYHVEPFLQRTSRLKRKTYGGIGSGWGDRKGRR